MPIKALKGVTFMKKLAISRKKIITTVSCLVLVLLAVFLFCWNFRYYSAKKVSAYYEEYSLYKPNHAYDAPVQAIIARHHSLSFKNAEGMSVDDVYAKWGNPHACVGSGVVRDIYFTTDGYLISVRYNWDAVRNIDTVYRIEKVKL